MSARWDELERLFDEGVALAIPQRQAWIDSLALDPELVHELRAMLAADATHPELTLRVGNVLLQAGELPLPGMRLGSYRLLHELGSGGMGLVFLAERADEQFRHQVAIKLIRGYAGVDAARQLRHERQVLAGLDHPGIARLLDGGETPGGQPYLVMEYVRGEPITSASTARELPLRQRLCLLRDIARAVHYAHQRLVIHRDIKPANVLLRDDGRPVLLDFGIAKLVDSEGQGDATQPWFTPAYASPEQRRGQPVSTATDIHALGLLLFELLTDQPPVKDARGALRAPSSVVPRARAAALRGDLDCIVLRATATEPTRRYASAEAVARDIERMMEGRPIRAAPDRATYRAGKFVRRHPFAVAVSAAFLLSLLVSGWRLADERDRAVRAELAAREQSQAALAVTTFLTDLFREAEPRLAANRSLTPTQLIDRGRDRLAMSAVGPAERWRLASTLGEIYLSLGSPEQSAAILQTAVTAARDADASAVDVSELLRRLGNAYDDKGDAANSTAVYQEALALARRSGDEGAIANSLTALGSTYIRSDRLAQGEAMLREALTLSERVFGAQAVHTAKTRSYLAEALAFSGRRDEARPIMDQAIASLRRQLAPDDQQLLRALSRYGVILLGQGESKAAEAVLLELIAHRERLLGPDSMLVANAHSGLGAVFYEQGRILEAEAQQRAALEIAERTLAPDDAVLATYRNSLAVVLSERGDYQAAIPLLRSALATREREADGKLTLGVVMYRQNLGRVLLLGGHAAQAHELLSLPIGDGGEHSGWALNRALQGLSLAYWQVQYGEPSVALDGLARVEARLADLGGPGSWRYATLLRYRAAALAALNRHDDAQAALVEALELLREKRGRDYVGCGEVALDLAEVDRQRGQHAAAARWLAEAQRVLEPVLVDNAPQRARLRSVRSALAA